MSDTTTAPRQKYKKPRFGRPDVPRPLAGLDMRSQMASVFVARLNEVSSQYPDGEPSRLREIAGLRIALEQVQLEVLKGNGKARDDLVRISNLISRRENELQARRFAAPIDRRPLHERIMDARPAKAVGKAATAAKQSQGSRVAGSPLSRMGEARAKAANTVADEGGDDG